MGNGNQEKKTETIGGVQVAGGAKIVLVIAGVQPYDLYLAYDSASDKYALTPSKPAGFTGTQDRDWFSPIATMAAAWSSIWSLYTDAAFKQAGWVAIPLFPLEQTSAAIKQAVFAALDAIIRLQPLALVVHYVGHGDRDSNGPCLEMERCHLNPDYRGNPPGAKKYTVLSPTGHARECVCSIKEVAGMIDSMKNSQTPVPPRTFIVDGCDCAPAIAYRDWPTLFFEIMAVDIKNQETIFVKFTEIFGSLKSGTAPLVTPDCFETDFPAKIVPVIQAVNAELKKLGKVAYVENVGAETQQSTIDKLR